MSRSAHTRVQDHLITRILKARKAFHSSHDVSFDPNLLPIISAGDKPKA